MSDWLTLLPRALDVDTVVVRIVVASTLGSSPREAGACMLVGTNTLRGSIGGGNLEFKAIEIARAMLQEERSWQTASFPLGPALGQCCGGMIGLWFERIEAAERAMRVADIANAKTDSYLVLKVPPIYHQNQEHFFRVVQLLPMIDTPELRARRMTA
jgi:xanthine/CO dehydrogenase XdhC/CoxF family maturation factor